MENIILPQNLALIICIVLILVLSFVISRHGEKKVSNKIFLLLNISVIVWVISNLIANMVLLNNDPSSYLIWTKISIFGPTFLPLLLILFSDSFPENKITLKKIYIWLLGVITAGIIILVPTSYNVKSVEILDAGQMESTFTPGILYIFFGFYLMFGIAVTAFMLIKKYLRSSQQIEKMQIKFVLIGLIISILLGVTLSAVLPLLGFSQFINVGPASTIFFIIFTFFAIVKYQLLDVKLIVAETVTYLVLIVLTIEILFSSSASEWFLRILFLVVMGYGGSVLINSMRNEIKQKEQSQKLSLQLADANQHLKELDHMKSEFVSLASHELLTPVSAIEGYLSMIIDEKLAKVDDPKAAKYLDRIYRSSRRLARLVADMLNVSRIEENRLLVEKEDINLPLLIKQVVEEIKFKAEERKQKVVFDNPDGPSSVGGRAEEDWETYGDPDKIKEILINLLGNSIKYSKDPGEIHIEIKKAPTAEIVEKWDAIESELKTKPLDDQEAIKSIVHAKFRELAGDEQLLISVKDQGIGIPKEELPKLFKKFHRVGDYTRAESQGTGLGLYISRALVELHHGRIWADSEGEGKGSTLFFSLPEQKNKEQIIELEKQVPQKKEQLKPLARPMGGNKPEEL